MRGLPALDSPSYGGESVFVHDSHKYVSLCEMTVIVICWLPFVEHMKTPRKGPIKLKVAPSSYRWDESLRDKWHAV